MYATFILLWGLGLRSWQAGLRSDLFNTYLVYLLNKDLEITDRNTVFFPRPGYWAWENPLNEIKTIKGWERRFRAPTIQKTSAFFPSRKWTRASGYSMLSEPSQCIVAVLTVVTRSSWESLNFWETTCVFCWNGHIHEKFSGCVVWKTFRYTTRNILIIQQFWIWFYLEISHMKN